jgi:hypothetical protein
MKKSITCLECEEIFFGGGRGKLLSNHVKKVHKFNSYNDYKIKHGLKKSKTQLLKEKAVICNLCGLVAHDLTSHILKKHNLTTEEYKKTHGEIRSKKFSTNINTSLSHWINKGFTKKEAKEKLKERQTICTLKKFIERHGEIEGEKRWNAFILKRDADRKKGFSKISQKLFWLLFNSISEENRASIHFAQLDENKSPDYSGKNYEYTLSLKTKVLFPDFIDVNSKKIIEFDGSYWHGEHLIKYPRKLKDSERDKLLNNEGYLIFHVAEKDFRKHPEKIVKHCLEFLYG